MRVTDYKYAIYFTWNDGSKDSIMSCDKEDRDLNIKDMLRRGDFCSIEYCYIYANGEYGRIIKVL